ncbi:MAG: hypothetical protein ACBR50_11990 [Microcoleus sp.]
MPTQPTTASEPLNQTKVMQNALLIFAGKVLIVKDTVNSIGYPIRNISSVRVSQKINTITKELPNWYWIFLGMGVVTIPLGISIFPIPMALFLSLMWDHIINRVQVLEEYGITLEMNSGSLSLFSGDKEFIDRAIIKLYQIINEEESKPMLFDFRRNVINDNSIQVKQAIQNGQFAVGVNNGEVHAEKLGVTINEAP